MPVAHSLLPSSECFLAKPHPAAAETAAKQHGKLLQAYRGLKQQHQEQLNQLQDNLQDDLCANLASLELARALVACFGAGWCLLTPEGIAQPPPPEWRAVAAHNTRHLA